jgi:hypothetical protein
MADHALVRAEKNCRASAQQKSSTGGTPPIRCSSFLEDHWRTHRCQFTRCRTLADLTAFSSESDATIMRNSLGVVPMLTCTGWAVKQLENFFRNSDPPFAFAPKTKPFRRVASKTRYAHHHRNYSQIHLQEPVRRKGNIAAGGWRLGAAVGRASHGGSSSVRPSPGYAFEGSSGRGLTYGSVRLREAREVQGARRRR